MIVQKQLCFRPIERMKTLSRAGLARVASWGSDRFVRMFMSAMQNSWMLVSQRCRRKFSMINTFQWTLCSIRAHMNDL